MNHVVGLYEERAERAERADTSVCPLRVDERAPVRAITRAKEHGGGKLHCARIRVPTGTIWSQILAGLSMVDSDNLCVHLWHRRGRTSRGRTRRTVRRIINYEQGEGLAAHRNTWTASLRARIGLVLAGDAEIGVDGGAR